MKEFETRSAKSLYCSKKCKNIVAYSNRTDGVFRYLTHIQRKVDGLIGHRRLIDPQLEQISEMLNVMKHTLKGRTNPP